MIGMLVFYRAPEDAEAFEKRYLEGHLPLVREYKNLGDHVFLKVTRALGNEFPYAYVFRGFWDDRESWKEDMGSEPGQRAAADADEFAKGLFDVVLFERLA